MKKDLLIAGSMRSGKTTLSSRLTDRFVHIQTDHLILTFQRIFPDLGIGRRGASFDELCDAFLPFLLGYAIHLAADQDRKYILDCHYIRPSDTLRLPSSFQTIFLGYPQTSTAQKVADLRAYASQHECYTSEITDESLYSFVTRWIAQSRKTQDECISLGIPFFDTDQDLAAPLDYLRIQP